MNNRIVTIIKATHAVVPSPRGIVDGLIARGHEEDDVDLRLAAMRLWLTATGLIESGDIAGPGEPMTANQLVGLLAAMGV